MNAFILPPTFRTVKKTILLFTLSTKIIFAQDGASLGDVIVYPALGDGGFTIGAPIGDEDAVHYAHTNRNALAVNSNQFPGEFARSYVDFTGVANTYNVTLSTLAENDGESTYILYIDGIEKGRQTNPTTNNIYSDTTLTLAQDLAIPLGAEISIESNATTNGLILEEGVPLYARGRFIGISLTATQNVIPDNIPVYVPFTKQIPNTNLQAEDYDESVETSPSTYNDNTYRDTSASGVEVTDLTLGGLPEVMVSLTDGESLTFNVNVTTEGKYDLEFQLATKNPSSAFRIFQDNTKLTDSDITVTITDSLDDFQTVNVNEINLSKGLSTITVENVRGFLNFNSFAAELTNPAVIPDPTGEAIITGELRKWHKVSLSWQGPEVSEFDGIAEDDLPKNDGHTTEGRNVNGVNPFTNYRLDVTFTHESGSPVYVIPGFFAAETYALDTNGSLISNGAANTLASSGDVWRVNFAPDEVGTWNYTASFLEGENIAIAEPGELSGGTPVTSIHGKAGSFTVLSTNKTGRDFRGKGRLQYVNKHHLQFAETGDFFMKAGVDSPENLLNYDDFDGHPTHKNKSWEAHESHYVAEEASKYTWGNGEKGKELLGAVRYLADNGLNAFSFLTFSVDGDDGMVFPQIFRGDNDEYKRVIQTKGLKDEGGNSLQEFVWFKSDLIYHQRFDVSKMAQWENIFAYGQELGLFLHFKQFEKENDKLMDGNGDLGIQRKLYYRELVARFGHHLALNWNLGEESQNSTDQLKDFAKWYTDNDPYDHHVVVHTPGSNGAQEGTYTPLLNDSSILTGASLQTRVDNFLNVYPSTMKWIEQSTSGDNPWVVTTDEPGAADIGLRQEDAEDNWKDARVDALWGNIIAGGGGVEFYFGSPSVNPDITDLKGGDYTIREDFWPFCRNASAFFENNDVQFQEMSNDNSKIFSDETYTLTAPDEDVTITLNDNIAARCLANPGSEYVILLRRGGTVDLDLTGLTGDFDVSWYNPRNTTAEGPSLEVGDVSSVEAGGAVNLGNAPMIDDFLEHGNDWIVYVKKSEPVVTTIPTGDKDSDNDGQSDQFEFAFGLDSTDGNFQQPVNLTQMTATDGKFTYTRHNPALTGFHYEILVSNDLINWQVDDAVIETIQSNGDIQIVTITSTALQNQKPAVFMRVQVTE